MPSLRPIVRAWSPGRTVAHAALDNSARAWGAAPPPQAHVPRISNLPQTQSETPDSSYMTCSTASSTSSKPARPRAHWSAAPPSWPLDDHEKQNRLCNEVQLDPDHGDTQLPPRATDEICRSRWRDGQCIGSSLPPRHHPPARAKVRPNFRVAFAEVAICDAHVHLRAQTASW